MILTNNKKKDNKSHIVLALCGFFYMQIGIEGEIYKNNED